MGVVSINPNLTSGNFEIVSVERHDQSSNLVLSNLYVWIFNGLSFHLSTHGKILELLIYFYCLMDDL
jgi:hypothetical protein